jgi:outer membrane protein assembly factor BamB
MSSQKFRRRLHCIACLLAIFAGIGKVNAVQAADQQSLAASARPVTDDDAYRKLRQIADSIYIGDFQHARTELRRFLDAAAVDGLVPKLTDESALSRFQSIADVTSGLVMSLPGEERLQFIQQSEREAARRLQSVLVSGGSNAELQDLADRNPGTASARRAQYFLISRFLDRGQFWLARSVLRKLRREAETSDEQLVQLSDRLRQADALVAASDKDRQGRTGSEPGNSDKRRESAAWQAAAAFEDSSVGWFQQALDEHRRQAVPVLPRLNPVIADNAVIGSTLNRLVAIETTTGRPLWEVESPATGSQRPSRAALTGALESLASISMARQVQLDTTYSRMVVDSERVLCLEYVSSFGRSLSPAEPLINQRAGDDAQPRNQLVARRVSDGQVEWKRGAFIVGESGFEDATAYFMGVPCVAGDWLVGVLQHDAALFAYALDRRDGTPQWLVRIGERNGNAAADVDWTSTACPVVFADGLLVCSTGAGLIVAVDPVFRRVAWARRYSRIDEPHPGSPLPGSATRQMRRWWSGWREITLLQSVRPSGADSAPVLLYAGPDIAGVRVLDVTTGDERARVPASPIPDLQPPSLQPLYLQVPQVQPGGDRPALVVGRHSLTAFNQQTGSVIWERGIPEPAGRGFFIDLPPSVKAPRETTERAETEPVCFYVFPATDGSTRFVRLWDGRIETGHAIDAGTPRTWTLCAAGVVEQTFEDLQLLPHPAFGSQNAIEWLTGAGGETEANDALLKSIQSASSEDALRNLVTRAGLVRTGSSNDLEASQSDESRFDRPGATHAVAAIGRAGELNADSIAFELLAALSERNPNGAVSLRDSGPERVVRYDRWIQGQLADLLASEGSTAAEGLRQRFAAMVESAARSRDPFALARFVERLRDVPGADQAEVRAEGRIGRSFLQNEIALLRLSAGRDSVIADDARRKLARLYRDHSYPRDAAAIEAATTSQTVAGRFVASQSEWNPATPSHTERPDRFEEVRYFPVPVRSSCGTLFDRLNVAVRLVGKTGSSLRFYGDGQAGYWSLDLPASDSALHTWFTLPRGWGVGRLLILRVGTELYGMTPYSDSGEPRAQLRWTLELADGNRLNTHQLTHAVPGFGAEDLAPLDTFDQPMAQIGPVMAGYLCYRDRAQLVCLDPETGQQLWTRSELQPKTRCVGDEQSIWLIDESSDEVTELRATDGSTRGMFRLTQAAGSEERDSFTDSVRDRLLLAAGSHWLIGLPQSDSPSLAYRRIAVFDVRKRTVLWSVETSETTAVFQAGRYWFGLLSEDGQLAIRDVRSGELIAEHKVEHPQRLRSVFCVLDGYSNLLALSSESEAGFQAVGEPRFGFRSPLINGQLIAISATDGSLLWQQPVSGERLPLDQPRSLPLITLTSRSAQAGKEEFVLRIVDRRDGRTLLRRNSSEQFSPFTFDPNAALQRVVLRFPRSVLRFDYDVR